MFHIVYQWALKWFFSFLREKYTYFGIYHVSLFIPCIWETPIQEAAETEDMIRYQYLSELYGFEEPTGAYLKGHNTLIYQNNAAPKESRQEQERGVTCSHLSLLVLEPKKWECIEGDFSEDYDKGESLIEGRVAMFQIMKSGLEAFFWLKKAIVFF